MTKARPPIVRLLQRVVETTGPLSTPCWLSGHHVRKDGYSQINVGGRDGGMIYVHRISYEHFIGPIPEGMDLDHLCRVRHCANPAHLEVVTPKVNTLRGFAPSIVLRRAGLCHRGHPLADAYVTKTGQRQCRECRHLRQRRNRAARDR